MSFMGSVGPISMDLGEICIANLRFPSWYFASHFMSELVGFKSLFVDSLVWYECACCYAEGRQSWGHCLLRRREGDLVLS